MDKNQPFKMKDKPKESAGSVPSFIKQVTNFSSSIINHVAHGLPQTSDPEQEKRLSICRECDKYIHNEGNSRCAECGCFLNIKTSWAGESCPLKKWLAVSKAEDCNCGK